MARTEEQKEMRRQKRKQEGQNYIRIDMTKEERIEWKAFAKAQETPLATMLRKLMKQEMNRMGWEWEKVKSEYMDDENNEK